MQRIVCLRRAVQAGLDGALAETVVARGKIQPRAGGLGKEGHTGRASCAHPRTPDALEASRERVKEWALLGFHSHCRSLLLTTVSDGHY